MCWIIFRFPTRRKNRIHKIISNFPHIKSEPKSLFLKLGKVQVALSRFMENENKRGEVIFMVKNIWNESSQKL